MKKVKGIKIPHSKNTAFSLPRQLPVPAQVRLPMTMHSGAPARPIVKQGDHVKVGQMIAEAIGAVSSPVHASVSGTIKSILDFDPLTGQKETSIVIESDGEQSIYEGLSIPSAENLDEFLDGVSKSGVVGLGGAGFPAAPKLNIGKEKHLDFLLINGAECEPYITSDTRIMVDQGEDVFSGSMLIKKFLKPVQTYICIEDNKAEAINKLKELCKNVDGIDVKILPTRFPQGERKILVYNVTGRVVPEGARLHDVGCLVTNCSTAALIGNFFKTGMPLCSRIVTVDGSAVKEAQNVIAPIGTAIGELFDFCGGFKEEPGKIIMGGPMMGRAVMSLDLPVVKTTNSILAINKKDSKETKESPCIKCGRCTRNCLMHLMPSFIEEAVALRNTDLLKKYKIDLCAECGTCAYLCPSKRKLSQVMVLAKKLLREDARK